MDARSNQAPAQDVLRSKLFPDGNFIELNSENPHLSFIPLSLATSVIRNTLYFKNLSSVDYFKYFDKYIGQWPINKLGINGLEHEVIESIFYSLSVSNNKFLLLGIDNISQASINAIYFQIILLKSGLPQEVHVIFGPTINEHWRANFHNLANPEHLAKKLKDVTKSLLEGSFTSRLSYRNGSQELEAKIAALAAKNQVLLLHQNQSNAHVQQLTAQNDSLDRKLRAQILAKTNLSEVLKTAEENLQTIKEEVKASQLELKTAKGELKTSERELKSSTEQIKADEIKILSIQQALAQGYELLSALGKELADTQKSFKDQEVRHQVTKAELLLLQQQCNYMQSLFADYNELFIQELKRCGLFSETKADEDFENNSHSKKRKKKSKETSHSKKRHKETKESAESFATDALMSIRQSTSPVIAPARETNNIFSDFQSHIIGLLAKHDQDKTPEALKLYIENQIKICESVFANGTQFKDLNSKLIPALLYYVLYLLCDIHHIHKITQLPMQPLINQYQSHASTSLTSDTTALAHTVTRMANAIFDTVNNNLMLRATNLNLSKELTQIKQGTSAFPPASSATQVDEKSMPSFVPINYSSSSSTFFTPPVMSAFTLVSGILPAQQHKPSSP